MQKSKQLILSMCIALLLVIAPGSANAQSSDQIRIQLLQELVALLQTQLSLLLEQEKLHIAYPIEDAVFFDDDSFLEDIDAEIIARYEINSMDIDSPSSQHKKYVDRMDDLLPRAYNQYFAELVVFESRRDDVDAFVETTLPYNNQWRYGVNQDVFEESVTSALNSELLIHEFAHLFSLHEVFTADRPSDCHDFFKVSGCVSADTIYGKYIAEFWSTPDLDEAIAIRSARNQSRAIDRFYDKNANAFVSRYAASSPAEDFAESFSHFVLFDDESFGLVADQKMQFFNRFSHTRDMKAEILSDL